VPKAVTLAALEEVGGPAFASRYASAKKAELSDAAERIFAGDFIGEVEVKERALAWVPEAMRFAPATEPAAVLDTDDLPPWEEAPSSPDGEAEPEREGDAGEVDGGEPSESIGEAA
jgi:ParB family chromosome partitioning protein